MFFLKLSTALLSLASSVASAAPAKEATPHGLAKRADGSSRAQAKNAVFDIDGWLNIAEINCYIMLCFMGGNRILSVANLQITGSRPWLMQPPAVSANPTSRRPTRPIPMQEQKVNRSATWTSMALLGPATTRQALRTSRGEVSSCNKANFGTS